MGAARREPDYMRGGRLSFYTLLQKVMMMMMMMMMVLAFLQVCSKSNANERRAKRL